MTAFVAFIRTYGIWFYFLFGFGILIGIRMIVGARRLSRKPLFSLDHERAQEGFSRGLTLIALMLLLGCALTAFIVIVVPIVPPPEPAIVRGLSPTAPAVFPTFPALPTATVALPKPTDVAIATSTPVALTTATLSTSATPLVVSTIAARPTTRPISLTPVYGVPAPVLVYERNKDPVFNGVVVKGDGEATTRNALIFKWDWNCDQCLLGPNDKYVITITFIDKLSGLPRAFGGSTTQQKFLTMYDILRSYSDTGQFYQKAVEDTYQWYVQVKRSPGDQPISGPSETWKFVWH